MCEYFTNVLEVGEFIDKKLNHLKQVLDKRRLVLGWRLDAISCDSGDQTDCVSIRLDWVDTQIRQLIRSLGNIEVETGTIQPATETGTIQPVTDTCSKDSAFRFWGVDRNETDYMTMRRPMRSVSVSDLTEVILCPEISQFNNSRDSINCELEEITSPVTKSPENSFFPTDRKEVFEDIYRPERKVSMPEWRNVELLSDPIYEIINKKAMREIAGNLGEKKRKRSKKVLPVYDLPVVAKCPQGKRLGQLDRPKGVAVCTRGRIFVAEKGNNRVQVFDSSANFIRSIGEKTGSNRMLAPYGLFVREDMVYVTLPGQHCIQMYTCQGMFVREKGRQGREEGRLKSPTGIDGDTVRGKVLVCDTGNNRIQLFDKDLKFIRVIRTTPLDRPLDVKVAKLGDFLVLDRSQTFLHLFNCFGELLREMIDSSCWLRIINPLFFTLSPQGDVILSDFSTHCVYVFGSDGNILWTIGEGGKGRPLEEPRGLVCDERGRLVTVSNKKMDSLQIFEL